MANRKGSSAISRRDNFNQSVIQILYKRAGGKCCRCGAPTFGPVSNNPYRVRNIGQAAHIAAAAPGGPRYDPSMSVEERTSVKNGVWLCSNCHDMVDRDMEEFTLKVLKEMKKKAEERARKEIGVAAAGIHPSANTPTSVLDAGISAATIVEIRKVKAELIVLHGQSLDEERGMEFLEAIRFINLDTDTYLTQVGTELIFLLSKLVAYCSQPSIALEVVRRLKEIAEVFHTSWTREELELVSQTVQTLAKNSSQQRRVRQSAVAQSAIALLKDLSTYDNLKKRKLSAIPKQLLGSLRSSDEPDLGEPQPKRAKSSETIATDTSAEEEAKYLAIMQQLADTQDTDTVLQLEAQLAEMGYEPNIL